MKTKIKRNNSLIITTCTLAVTLAAVFHEPDMNSQESGQRALRTASRQYPAIQAAMPAKPADGKYLKMQADGLIPAAAIVPGAAVNTSLEAGPLFRSSILSRRDAVIAFDKLAEIRKAGQGTLIMDLGLPEGPVQAELSSVTENHDGGYSLAGAIAAEPRSRVLMTVQDEALVGDISLDPQREFTILPGPVGAPHELRRINRSILPICDGQVEAGTAALPGTASGMRPELPLSPAESSGRMPEAEMEKTMMADSTPVTAGGQSPAPSHTGVPAAADTTIDVMILYTQPCLTRMRSQAGMIAAMNQAVAEANLAFSSSGVSCAVRLTHHQLVSFTPTKMNTDLGRLQRAGDGILDEALLLRDLHAADNVSLWHNYLNDAAGVGYLTRSASQAKTYGFNIVDIDYAIHNRSWIHEVGHNMGMNHDQANATGLAWNKASYGHRFTGATTGTLYGTIMAYPPGQRVGQFSNPGVNYDGTPTGTAVSNNAAVAVASKTAAAAARVPMAPVITQQPEDVSVGIDEPAVLNISVTGTNPAFQWLSGTSADNLKPVAGAIHPTLVQCSDSGGPYYQCVVQNSAGTLRSRIVTAQFR